MLVVSWFISNFVAFIAHNYLFCLFANNKKFKINFIMLFLASIMGLIFYFVTKFISQDYIYIRPYIAHLYIFICLLFIYKDNKRNKCTFIPFLKNKETISSIISSLF